MKVPGMPEDLFLERSLIDLSDMTKLKFEKMAMTTVLYLSSVFDRQSFAFFLETYLDSTFAWRVKQDV